jgi:lipopolysaccharide export system protein LptA
MRWQKIAQIAIALFVVAFAGVVFVAMRKHTAAPKREERLKPALDSTAMAESGAGEYRHNKDGKLVYSLAWKNQLSYKDGRSSLRGVTLVLPKKDDRTFTVVADEGNVTAPADSTGNKLNTAILKGNVVLTTDDGIVVKTQEATYTDAEGMVRVPGPVEFTRGRMKGTGVGATYDKNRDVLWVLDQAHVTVAPDATGGGALDGSASNAGLARADNYMKLVKSAQIASGGQTASADEITMLLDEKGEKVQQMQLRENSKIVGTGPGAQSMSARHIDMTYGPDGRALQHSKLMENGVLDLPGPQGSANRRIVGNTIDLAMSPDGKNVTNLDAQEKVQVDIPEDGDSPAKKIIAKTLHAVGAPEQGLQNAVFEGPVQYFETRPPGGKLPALDRRATSLRLIVDTKPGLGAIERADFLGNAKFVDTETSAEAARALYNIANDQLDLSPSPGLPGTGPLLNNKQLTVQARNIHVSPSTQKLIADTDVRSIIKPQSKSGTTGTTGTSGSNAPASQTKVPVMLKQDRPVNVTSNRLAYDGKSEATYTGDALLWQDQSRIAADTIVLDNTTGNLTAKEHVRSTMIVQADDSKTKQKKSSESKVTADLLVYEDAKRLATYTVNGTTPATLNSPEGTITGDRLDLFLKESGNELERLISDGKIVTTKLEKLYATGKHLVYTSVDQKYVMTGEPVDAIQKDDQGACKQSKGITLTYVRGTPDNMRLEALTGLAPVESKPIDPCPAELRN